MRRRFAGVCLTLLGLVLVVAGQASCGEQVTNVFSNVTAPPGATQSP